MYCCHQLLVISLHSTHHKGLKKDKTAKLSQMDPDLVVKANSEHPRPAMLHFFVCLSVCAFVG